MAGQMTQLLVDVAREVKGLQVTILALQGENERLRGQTESILQELAGLKAEKRRDGEERRKVDKRLGSGDHTFGKLESMIGTAEQIATSAYELAQKALEAAKAAAGEKSNRTLWEKLKEKAVEALVPMAVGVVFWALYHLLLIGPEIAKLMKKVGP